MEIKKIFINISLGSEISPLKLFEFLAFQIYHIIEILNSINSIDSGYFLALVKRSFHQPAKFIVFSKLGQIMGQNFQTNWALGHLNNM